MKNCEVCKENYIFEDECPFCKPLKDHHRKLIISLEEEFWHIIGEDDSRKAGEIVQAILKELKL